MCVRVCVCACVYVRTQCVCACMDMHACTYVCETIYNTRLIKN